MAPHTSRISRFNLLLLAFSVGVGLFISRNPILFGRKASHIPQNFKILTSHPVLDRVLQEHQSDLGDDYIAYRNHCLRVLSFAAWFLKEDATESALHLLAYALAYHDLALWTDGNLAYLEPSAARAARDTEERLHETDDEMQDTEARILQSFNNARDLATVREVVLRHHKLTPWAAPPGSLADARLVNAARQADWADATKGVVRFGLTAGHIEKAYAALPDAHFHAVLAGMCRRLSPDSFWGRFRVLSIFEL